MKVLVENQGYKLCYTPDKLNRWIVYKSAPMGMSNDLKFEQMVAHSSVFTKKLKSYFTPQQCQTAIAKVHAMKYVNRKFKA